MNRLVPLTILEQEQHVSKEEKTLSMCVPRTSKTDMVLQRLFTQKLRNVDVTRLMEVKDLKNKIVNLRVYTDFDKTNYEIDQGTKFRIPIYNQRESNIIYQVFSVSESQENARQKQKVVHLLGYIGNLSKSFCLAQRTYPGKHILTKYRTCEFRFMCVEDLFGDVVSAMDDSTETIVANDVDLDFSEDTNIEGFSYKHEEEDSCKKHQAFYIPCLSCLKIPNDAIVSMELVLCGVQILLQIMGSQVAFSSLKSAKDMMDFWEDHPLEGSIAHIIVCVASSLTRETTSFYVESFSYTAFYAFKKLDSVESRLSAFKMNGMIFSATMMQKFNNNPRDYFKAFCDDKCLKNVEWVVEKHSVLQDETVGKLENLPSWLEKIIANVFKSIYFMNRNTILEPYEQNNSEEFDLY